MTRLAPPTVRAGASAPAVLLAALSLAACGTSSAPVSPVTDASHDDAKVTAHDAGHFATHPDASNPPPDAAAHHDAAEAGPIVVCNGHAELCGRTYDAVTYPGTHGSYSVSTEGFEAPDQTYSIARQLQDGIRVLHFEVHIYNGGVYACHSICAIGSRLLTDDMASVASFVKAHPGDVVTLLLERSDANITANDIGDAMKQVGLLPYMRVQDVGAPWPTLFDMLTKNERVVALLDNPTGSSYDWLLPRWQLTWETPWDNEKPSDFAQCDANRGAMGDGVYVVDTYLEDQVIDTPAHAELVNYDPFLVERLLFCQQGTTTLPNFAMVNFYDVSDVFTAVDVMNGFAPVPADVNLATFPPCAWPSDGGVDGGCDGGSSSDAGDAGSDASDGASG